jgi:carboxypeptidase family protein/TonB-dependent receptor-like protein
MDRLMACSPGSARFVRLLALCSLLVSFHSVPARAQRAEARQPVVSAGAIQGTVTTQGTIPLGGIVVTLRRDGSDVATAVSDADGKVRFEHLSPGTYSIVAASQGFDTFTSNVAVVGGGTADIAIDLRIAALSDTVDVVAPTTVVPNTGTLTSSEGLTRRELEEINPGGGLQSALRLLASVIEVPGGLAIKGGRPNQAATQLGAGTFVDPATGLSQVSLPDDAIDSVTVLPNPYAVEYGRFSSGLVLIRTRRGSDVWKTRINKLDPSLRTTRGQPFTVVGISAFSPRFETGGPLVKDRVFLQQAAQYQYRATDVASRPQSELRTLNRFSSFTRLDANLTPRHLLVAAGGLFPASARQATLGTFTPPDATVNTRGRVSTASFTERSLWSDAWFSETTGEIHSYKTTISPRGSAPMELLPETTFGNFFNRQQRATSTYQLIESIAGTFHKGGLHMVKGGIDVLHSRFHGTSASRTVLIRRTDGTLARRLDFSPSLTTQSVNSTDLAAFAQDRLQPTSRWYIEIGGRLDRDGVIGRFNITPRVGSALLLNSSGTSVLRSGYGVFYERTPSVAGAFEAYETPLDTRFAADGITRLGPPVLLSRVSSPDLRTSRSFTWDLALDHRVNGQWTLHAGVIDRRGSHDLLIEPEHAGGAAVLRLKSDGRSRYREGEISAHFKGGPGVDVNMSYVYSQARADLNAFTNFFDNVLAPVVGQNGYGPARADVPHRFLARGRATPLRNWLLVGVLDWRSGLPYSVVDEWLDYVGPRNNQRFPSYFRVDAGIEHRFKIKKYRPWIGVRADNALSSFLPSDVQANRSSPAFGTFYNSEYRQFRIQVRFEP